MLHLLTEDLHNQGVAGREVAIKRADPHAGLPGDHVQACEGAFIRERLLGGFDDALAVPQTV